MFVLNDCKVQDEKVRPFCFSIQVTKQASMITGESTTHGIFYFEADNERDKKDWLAAIRKAARQSVGIFDKTSVKTAWREYLKTSQISLVTCPLTQIGQEVIRLLLLRGVRVRALVTGIQEANMISDLFSHFVEVAEGDIFNDNALQKACTGVTKIFMLAPPNIQFVKFARQLIAAAQAEKVKRIVKLSDWCEKFPTNVR